MKMRTLLDYKDCIFYVMYASELRNRIDFFLIRQKIFHKKSLFAIIT